MDDVAPVSHDSVYLEATTAAIAFRAGVGNRPVRPGASLDEVLARVGGDLPSAPTPPRQVLTELLDGFSPGITASAGPRFFGFVIGGAMPAATAAELVTVGWDQCAFNATLSPAAAAAEQVAAHWLLSLLGLPMSASVGYVTGAQGANTVSLATARHRVLAEAGWDVERDGLQGAPRVRVVASVERHATIDRSLRLLGLGTAAVQDVAASSQGAIDVGDLARVLESGRPGPTIVCLQAGNVNTGACDDLRGAIDVARAHEAWVHVDGAFGLWAAASPTTRHLVDGAELADSWSCDAHKWLNVPYDCGFAICANPEDQAAALSYTAAYLTGQGTTTPTLGDLVPESSRRARGFAVWAALRELGTDGVADLVERCCALARRCAAGLTVGGAEVVNDVVLNQVLVSCGDDGLTDRIVAEVQREGTCWLGATTWHGRRLLRVSVSNWSTTEDDIDRSVSAILRAAAAVGDGAS
jgi:glutamate/tyrosine decarboxylase-like PLP-dependent enzyme